LGFEALAADIKRPEDLLGPRARGDLSFVFRCL